MANRPLKLFYSYSHEDEELRNKLEKHLSLLKRRGVVSSWYDRQIEAGNDWAKEIHTNLENAEVILLLVSSDFLASDYCYCKEMDRALERHGKGLAKVIPVILRDCEWQQAPFARLQALPKNAHPVTLWADRDQAFTDVARGIRRTCESLQKSIEEKPGPPSPGNGAESSPPGKPPQQPDRKVEQPPSTPSTSSIYPCTEKHTSQAKIEARVRILKSEPPSGKKPKYGSVRTVNRITANGNPGFIVLMDERTVDLRGWKRVPPEKVSYPWSLVTVSRRLWLKKIKNAKYYEAHCDTTGLEVVMQCRDDFPIVCEAQRGESFVGHNQMKSRKLSIDVSRVPVGREFALNLLYSFWNTEQLDEHWHGARGYKNSVASSFLLVFPKNKPFKSHQRCVSLAERQKPIEFNGGTVLEGEKKDWIFWEICRPKAEHIYRLHWTW
jgi:hypothetical protein